MYGCVTYSFSNAHHNNKLRIRRHGFLLRCCIGSLRTNDPYRVLLSPEVIPTMSECKRPETSIRRRPPPLRTGFPVGMDDSRLPKRVVSGQTGGWGEEGVEGAEDWTKSAFTGTLRYSGASVTGSRPGIYAKNAGHGVLCPGGGGANGHGDLVSKMGDRDRLLLCI